jgi:hypothetical protein
MSVLTAGTVLLKHPFHGGAKAVPVARDVWMDATGFVLRWTAEGKRAKAKGKKPEKDKDGNLVHALRLSAVTAVSLGAGSEVLRSRNIAYPWRCIALHTSIGRTVDLQARDDKTAVAWFLALQRVTRAQLKGPITADEREAEALQRSVRSSSGSLGAVLLGGKAKPKF